MSAIELESRSPWQAKILVKQLEGGRGGRSDALRMPERKEGATCCRKPIPSNEKKGVADRELTACSCVDDEHIDVRGSGRISCFGFSMKRPHSID